MWSTICFTQSTNANVNLTQSHPHRHTLGITLAKPRCPIQLTHEISHHSAGYCFKAMSIHSLPFLCSPMYCKACFLDIIAIKNMVEVLPMDQLERGFEARQRHPPSSRVTGASAPADVLLSGQVAFPSSSCRLC